MSYYTPEAAGNINWVERWKRHRIPQRFWGLELQCMTMTAENRRALLAAKEFVDTFDQRYIGPDQEPGADRTLLGKGLVIVGAPGAGKSRLACGVATSVHLETNQSVLYMPVTNYFALGRELQQLQDTAKKLGHVDLLDSVDRLLRLRHQVLTKPLLIWDDLGKEYTSASDWVGKEVHRILRTRFDKGLPTIISTNVELSEWNKYDGAMFSFLHEAFDVAAFSGKDWRRARQ